MKAFDRQFVVECAATPRVASVAFSVPFPMVGKLSVGQGFSRRDGRSEALQDGAGEMSCSRRFRLFSKNRSRR